MLSLNLLLLDQLKFLLNVFILIPYRTVFKVSPARFIHVYVYISQQNEKWKEDDNIAESFRAVGGASDLLHDFVRVGGGGGGCAVQTSYCIYFVEVDHVFI